MAVSDELNNALFQYYFYFPLTYSLSLSRGALNLKRVQRVEPFVPTRPPPHTYNPFDTRRGLMSQSKCQSSFHVSTVQFVPCTTWNKKNPNCRTRFAPSIQGRSKERVCKAETQNRGRKLTGRAHCSGFYLCVSLGLQ